MIIKSIQLSNIRSYLNSIIEFEDGINFLSGDIGCGKSSILLAIEFALFGFKKGDIDGFQLLRKGEKEGFVKLILINPKTNDEIENVISNFSPDIIAISIKGNIPFRFESRYD